MTDIEITTDETLELDAIIDEWSDPQSVIQKHNVDSNNYNLKGFKTHTGVFNPQESGTYEFKINGQILSIKVTDASTIPSSEMLEDFESGNLDSYTGDVGSWSINSSTVYEGSYSAFTDNNAMILRDDVTVQQGQIVEARLYSNGVNSGSGFLVGTSGVDSSDVSGYILGHQTAGSYNSVTLSRYDNGAETTLASSTVSPSENEWLRAELQWFANGKLIYTLEEENGNQIEQFEVNDTTYTEGGIGWYVNTGNDVDEMWVDKAEVIGLTS